MSIRTRDTKEQKGRDEFCSSEPHGPKNSDPMLYARMNDAGDAFDAQRNLMRFSSGPDGGGSIEEINDRAIGLRIIVDRRRPLQSFWLAPWLPPRAMDISSMSWSIAFVCSSTHFGFGQAAPVSRSSSIRCALSRARQASIRRIISVI